MQKRLIVLVGVGLAAACTSLDQTPTAPMSTATPPANGRGVLGSHDFVLRKSGKPLSSLRQPGGQEPVSIAKVPHAVPLDYSSAPMSYQGGPLLSLTNIYAIFPGSEWTTNPGDRISSVESFFQGYSGSLYANIAIQYNGVNVAQTTFLGSVIDGSTNWAFYPGDQGLGDYVCSIIQTRGLQENSNLVYFVYTTLPPLGGSVAGRHVAVNTACGRLWAAVIFNDDGLATGFGGRSSQAASLATVSAHELVEAMTDPLSGTGWIDSNNFHLELGDKCELTESNAGFVTLSNGDVFNLQGMWSTLAFQAGKGIPNNPGCVVGALTPAILTGAQQLDGFFNCQWDASPTGGTPPYSYSWIGSQYVQGGSEFLYRQQSSFTMSVKYMDANGLIGSPATMFVYYYQYGPTCQ